MPIQHADDTLLHAMHAGATAGRRHGPSGRHGSQYRTSPSGRRLLSGSPGGNAETVLSAPGFYP
jgi:hypothetical protein